MVFAEREWIFLAGSESTYWDDIADRRFIPNDVPGRIVTAGHLGRSREEQRHAADAMDLPLLSSTVTPDWRIRGETPAGDDWKVRFAIIYGLLQRARRREQPREWQEEQRFWSTTKPTIRSGVGCGGAGR